jgi:hypothetical protein
MYGPARQIPNCSSARGLGPPSGIIERAPERARVVRAEHGCSGPREARPIRAIGFSAIPGRPANGNADGG